MGKYSEKELSYLMKLKEKIIHSHKKCKGVGYLEFLQPCECMKVFLYVKELFYSKIPMDYWNLSLEELIVDNTYKKIVDDYIDNIDNAMSQGLGIIFSGDKGIGKTSLMCEIAKSAIVRRYNVYYEIVQNIIDDRFNDEQAIINRVKQSDLVLMDEFDKVIMRNESNIPKQIENLLREILPNRKAILIGTNLDEEEIERKFQITSLTKRYMKIIYVVGEDFSEKRQKDWLDRLRSDDINFFSKNILSMAEEFHRNEYLADEREYNDLIKEDK